ncbi:tRNA (adenosine(37)-N6)-threonylcarbamoyltransferase complex dimerization subunit type 1 TsaB [Aliikangiella maris]|uniref:tRNA (Adenosine(37)-N6)-threonylcarbamoyltransferase complex dimerization subunit type 1 TsaB n=2 Tax=Aliikangiella maris TaxID=3162458 RepID=A0ABV3ML12_9GAMM
MSRLISIDTSTEAFSVALYNQGEVLEEFAVAPREHARRLLPAVESLLANAQLSLSQLDGMVCTVGPGAFTGIRIGVSVAQGLAEGADLPVIPVSSLANMAQQVILEQAAEMVFTAIDARMQEVYFAVYQADENSLPRIYHDEVVISPQQIDIKELLSKIYLQQQSTTTATLYTIGSGWQSYAELFDRHDLTIGHLNQDKVTFAWAPAKSNFPKASASFPLALEALKQQNELVAEQLQPVYLRNNVAIKKSVEK